MKQMTKTTKQNRKRKTASLMQQNIRYNGKSREHQETTDVGLMTKLTIHCRTLLCPGKTSICSMAGIVKMENL